MTFGLIGAPPAAVHATVQIADQVETQAIVTTTGAPAQYNVSTTPSIDYTAAWPGWTLGLREATILTARAYETGSPSLDLLEQGSLHLVYKYRHFRATLDEQGSYGKITYATPATAVPGALVAMPTTPIQPGNETIFTASSRTALDLGYTFSRHFDGSFYGGYAMSGGADQSARALIPFQTGPIGGLRGVYTFSREDTFEAHADYARTDFTDTPCTNAPTTVGVIPTGADCTPKDDQVTATIGLRHLFSRRSDLLVQGGASVVGQQESPKYAYTVAAYPSANAVFTFRTPAGSTRTTAHAGVLLAPIISQLTGAVDLRLQGEAGVDWTNQRVSVHGQLRGSQSVPSDAAGTYFDLSSDASLSYLVRRGFTVTAGGQIDGIHYAAGHSLTTGQPTGASNIAAGLAYLRLTVTSRTLHF